MFKLKRGFAPIIVLLLILVIASGIVFYVTRNQKKLKVSANSLSTPVGNIVITPNTVSNDGSATLTATGVQGANDAQVESVRYYLLNPKLAPGNNWGNPDWCSGGNPCTQDTTGGYITYDISESSNPGNNYQIIWDKNTHSSGSTPYSRALTPANILPGNYTVGMRIQDVNGNVAGNAGTFGLIITPPLGISISQTSVNLSIPNGGVAKAFDLTNLKGQAGAFQFFGYPTTNANGINWNPYSGGLQPNGKLPINIEVKNTSPGTYTGTGVLQDIIGSGKIYIPVSITVTPALPSPSPTPLPSPGSSLTVFPTSINLTIPSGGKMKAFDLKNMSNLTGGFNFYGYPTSKGPGINLNPSSGGIQANFTLPVNIEVYNTNPGTYTGTQILLDASGSRQADIPVTITVPPLTTDSDLDGFNNGREARMGTDPLKACGYNAWPPDFNNDKVVNSTDLNILSSNYPIGGKPPYNARYDLNADGAINSTDLGLEASYNGKSCI